MKKLILSVVMCFMTMYAFAGHSLKLECSNPDGAFCLQPIGSPSLSADNSSATAVYAVTRGTNIKDFSNRFDLWVDTNTEGNELMIQYVPTTNLPVGTPSCINAAGESSFTVNPGQTCYLTVKIVPFSAVGITSVPSPIVQIENTGGYENGLPYSLTANTRIDFSSSH